MILTAWLVSPILVVAFLCFWIVVSLQEGPKMDAPAVGAGSGETGGANAIGEMLARRRARAKVTLIVEDRTALASVDRPLLVGLDRNAWEGEPMTPVGEERWAWNGEAGALAEGFDLFWIDADGTVRRDPSGRRRLTISAGEQIERLEKLPLPTPSKPPE